MTLRQTLLCGLALACGALVPAPARAGGCPMCTTSADCVAMTGAPAFCVLHDGDFGCGTQRQACCPGQACAVMGGVPSCVTDGTCTIVDPDGGTAHDAGSATDAGSGTDAGVAHDAGMATMDAGAGVDGGTGTTRSGGCCQVGGAAPLRGPLVLSVLLFAFVAVVRRVR